MKKPLAILLIAVPASALVWLIALIAHKAESCPQDWRAIKVGMDRSHILSLVSESDSLIDWRDEKGFDVITRIIKNGSTPEYWQLLVFYDGKEKITEAQIEYHSSWGRLGRVLSRKIAATEPNQSLETTTMAVTPAASHPSRQP